MCKPSLPNLEILKDGIAHENGFVGMVTEPSQNAVVKP
jgi:hypothetical protein